MPETVVDLEELIRVQAQESLHLEYKDSRALDPNKRGEIAKDVSAFANSDGGLLIYGIREDGHIPVAIDQGADDTKISREWLEQILLSNISPVIDGVDIRQIPLTKGHSAYALTIPKSYRAPHQERTTKKYFKRHNFKSEPMEDYEISDVRSRSLTLEPLVLVDVFLRHRNMAYFLIENIGRIPAHDITIAFSPEPSWRRGIKPPLLDRGIKYFAPGRRHLMYYGSLVDILKEGSDIPAEFTVTATYVHPATMSRTSDTFLIDFRDFLNTAAIDSDVVEQGKSIESAIQKVVSELQKMQGRLETISAISGQTGLHLSFRTVMNLHHLLKGDGLVEKLDPEGQEPRFFEEVLGVDSAMAHELFQYFWSADEGRKLDDIPGMTSELKQKIESFLKLSPERQEDDPGT